MQPARFGFILGFFSQGHAAVKGKELKAWKIQEVKAPVQYFLSLELIEGTDTLLNL